MARNVEKNNKDLMILVGAGGTSGHINPALTLADYTKAQKPTTEIVFCGLKDSLEADIVTKAGYKLDFIKAVVLPSKGSKRKLRWLRETVSGIKQCLRCIKKYKPDVVVSTGGFVGSPLVFAALLSRIPVLLHEQNALPGRSNRFFGPYSKAVCISFKESEKYFKAKTKTVLTGNPVSSDFFNANKEEARDILNIDQDAFQIVIMGGSLGAKTLNNAVMDIVASGKWAQLIQDHPNLYLTISTGMNKGKEIKDSLSVIPHIHASEYLYNGQTWLAAADLFIGRAGAMTCSEIAALGLPSILVPFPFAKDDHQTINAKTLSDIGAALLCRDRDFTADYLYEKILYFLTTKQRLSDMSVLAKSKGLPDATAKIYSTLMQVVADGKK
ncbi:MAG TPA: undecaprenyldiphospho-muramoylpentapeptide beta-N-acetylglucosaminyltransferase [Clostridiaceae bacterium]|nr:undecaprenyldiphospho-muramoylpentapeptide beta-N-acetylglucosaminyltransferase [Clostridiaceae bacterium]